MRSTLLSCAVGALLLAATGCIPGAAGSPRTAAVVNGDEIPISLVEQRFESVSQNPQVQSQLQFDQDGTIVRQIQAQVLSQLIRSRVLEQGARELGIEVSEGDVAETRAEIVEEVGGEEAFDLIIEQNNLSEEDVESQIRDLAIQDRVQEAVTADIEVADEEIEAFYEQNRESRYDLASARHIMVDSEPAAQAVLERLNAGEDFAALAAELSLDQGSAQTGGDLGEFSRGRYPPVFEDAVFAAEEGEVLGPLQVDQTWHIIEVTDRATQSLAEARGDIRDELLEQRRTEAFQAWQQASAEEATILVNPRFGRWDDASGQVVVSDPLGETRAPLPADLDILPTPPSSGQ